MKRLVLLIAVLSMGCTRNSSTEESPGGRPHTTTSEEKADVTAPENPEVQRPSVIAESDDPIGDVRVDESHIYWVTHPLPLDPDDSTDVCSETRIWRIAKSGGTPESFVEPGDCVMPILRVADFLIWFDERGTHAKHVVDGSERILDTTPVWGAHATDGQRLFLAGSEDILVLNPSSGSRRTIPEIRTNNLMWAAATRELVFSQFDEKANNVLVGIAVDAGDQPRVFGRYTGWIDNLSASGTRVIGVVEAGPDSEGGVVMTHLETGVVSLLYRHADYFPSQLVETVSDESHTYLVFPPGILRIGRDDQVEPFIDASAESLRLDSNHIYWVDDQTTLRAADKNGFYVASPLPPVAKPTPTRSTKTSRGSSPISKPVSPVGRLVETPAYQGLVRTGGDFAISDKLLTKLERTLLATLENDQAALRPSKQYVRQYTAIIEDGAKTIRIDLQCSPSTDDWKTQGFPQFRGGGACIGHATYDVEQDRIVTLRFNAGR